MKVAIIGGTGFYKMLSGKFSLQKVKTRFGEAEVYAGEDTFEDYYFLPRHGKEHLIPPHKINYRANIAALKSLGVARILATFAVGSISKLVEPGKLAVVDQFLDFTTDREATFFDGGEDGLVHVEVNQPYCHSLSQNVLDLAPGFLLDIEPTSTYVATNGPRFETPAEIQMYAKLGGDVVGMTGVPEAVLARELQIHYGAVAHSINWAAGLQQKIEIVREGVEETRKALLDLFVEALKQPLKVNCECQAEPFVMHPPKWA